MTDVGNLRVVIGADTSQLEKGAQDSTKSLKTLQDQVQQLSGVLNTAGNTFLSFSGTMSTVTRQGRELTDVFLRPLKNVVLDSAIAWGLWRVGLMNTQPEMEKFSGSLLTNRIQLNRLGLEGGQITGILKKMGDDFVQIQPPMRQVVSVTGQMTITTTALANQMGALSPQVAQAATTMQLLTMGGVVGAVVYATVSAFNSAKQYADSLVDLGQRAKYAEMSLQDFQQTQEALATSGGLSAEKFASGTEAIAKNLFEAGRQSTELSKLLKVNNIEFEKGGKLTLDTTAAIRVMADLIRNASSGAQQLRIVSAFGVDRDWIRAVQDGSEAIQELIDKGPKYSAMVDQSMIDKAAKFSEAWRSGLSTTMTYLKAFAGDALEELKKFEKDSGFFKNAGSMFSTMLAEAKDRLEILRKYGTGFNPETMTAEHRQALEELREKYRAIYANIKAMKEYNRQLSLSNQTKPEGFDEAGFLGFGATPPKKTTKDAPVDDSSTRDMERRLDHLRQILATEDDAIRVQHENQLKEIDKFNEARLLKDGEYELLKRESRDKFDKKTAELFYQKFEAGTATEAEAMQRRFERQLLDLQVFLDNKAATENLSQEKITAITMKGEETRKKIEAKYALERTLLQANQWAAGASIVQSSLANITAVVGEESGKQFTVMKAIATAAALVQGYAAAVAAWKAGMEIGGPAAPVIAAAFAAASLAGTGAIIAKIAGVGQNSGGSPGGAPSPGAGAATSAATTTAAGGGGGGGEDNRTLTVRGISSKDLFSGSMVRDLAKELLDFQRDGGKVVFTS